MTGLENAAGVARVALAWWRAAHEVREVMGGLVDQGLLGHCVCSQLP